METLLNRLRAGDVRGLARAITGVVERERGAEALLRAAYAHTGHARVVGLTGPPGSGKSTLVDALARRYRAAGETLGIVAVDPTSPFTGGAILGDRIRMQAHHNDPGIFIRSLATRGALGGLAQAASEVVALLDASGKDRILVETVGVGQDEVDIIQLADVTVVVLVPGMGDEVQAIKAGLMEIADVFVINKAERGPERLEQEIQAMLALAPSGGGEAWRPPIVKTVATSGEGVENLQAAIAQRLEWLESHGGLTRHRARQWQQRLRQLARDRLAERLLAPLLTEERLAEAAEAIAREGADPYAAVDALIDKAILAQR
ncbi:MAG TPA: methylmalonyl Co-A mutase-associated GTPase MeaB [Terriglobales bacterium]|nr:methylmalonyl Co-A mutase-associated GTPase MeaB [Terriglobales bacterium]